MEDDLKKKMEDDLNFKPVLLSLFNNKNLKNKWFWHHRDWPIYVVNEECEEVESIDQDSVEKEEEDDQVWY